MAQRKESSVEDRGASAHGYEHTRTGPNVEYERGAGGSPRRHDGSERREGDPDREGDGFDSVGQVLGRHPYPSLLTGFGFGFGLGLVVTLLVYRRQPSWFERNVSDPIQQLHLPDRIKQVPDAIGSHLPSSWTRW